MQRTRTQGLSRRAGAVVSVVLVMRGTKDDREEEERPGQGARAARQQRKGNACAWVASMSSARCWAACPCTSRLNVPHLVSRPRDKGGQLGAWPSPILPLIPAPGCRAP